MKVLIVDDEAPARARMRRLVELYPEHTIVGEAVNGLEALEKVDELSPDLVFLDIEMPELDGLAVAKCLHNNHLIGGPQIIFVTAFDDRALSAFEVAAVDYLVKPVSPERLADSLARAAARKQNSISQTLPESLSSPKRIAAKCGNRYLALDPRQISAIVSRNHYSAIICEGREILSDESLEDWLLKLSNVGFLRVHRSAIMNLNYLKELQRLGDRKYVAVLNDPVATKLQISRERLEDVRSVLRLSQ